LFLFCTITFENLHSPTLYETSDNVLWINYLFLMWRRNIEIFTSLDTNKVEISALQDNKQ